MDQGCEIARRNSANVNVSADTRAETVSPAWYVLFKGPNTHTHTRRFPTREYGCGWCLENSSRLGGAQKVKKISQAVNSEAT